MRIFTPLDSIVGIIFPLLKIFLGMFVVTLIHKYLLDKRSKNQHPGIAKICALWAGVAGLGVPVWFIISATGMDLRQLLDIQLLTILITMAVVIFVFTAVLSYVLYRVIAMCDRIPKRPRYILYITASVLAVVIVPKPYKTQYECRVPTRWQCECGGATIKTIYGDECIGIPYSCRQLRLNPPDHNRNWYYNGVKWSALINKDYPGPCESVL